MEFKDAVKIVHPDKFDAWWKGIDKDKDYQEETDKLLDEPQAKDDYYMSLIDQEKGMIEEEIYLNTLIAEAQLQMTIGYIAFGMCVMLGIILWIYRRQI